MMMKLQAWDLLLDKSILWGQIKKKKVLIFLQKGFAIIIWYCFLCKMFLFNLHHSKVSGMNSLKDFISSLHELSYMTGVLHETKFTNILLFNTSVYNTWSQFLNQISRNRSFDSPQLAVAI